MRILIPLLLAMALAGCSDSGTSALVTIDDGGKPSHISIAFSPEDRPTAAEYAANGKAHPDFYNVHDLMIDWESVSGRDVEFEFFESSFGWGFFLSSIDGAPAEGANQFWSLSVNGDDSEKGASEVKVSHGDHITWTLKSF